MIARLRRTISIGVCAATALLSACAIGPKYVRPDADVPAAYKEDAVTAPVSPAATTPQAPPAPGWITAQPDDAAPRGSWWTVFGDDDLNALENRVDGSNQNLRVALAQLRQARATVDIAHASFFPTVTAGAAADQSLTSANIQYRGAAGHTLPDYALPVSASWEPDLWDRIGHSVDSAQANAQASLGDLESLRLGIHAELATDYFNLRGLDAEKELLDQTIVAYQQALDLTNNRFKGGIASQSDVAQAQTQLEMTQAQEIDLGVLRAQYEHAIASLVGQPASSFEIPARPVQWSAPSIPAGLSGRRTQTPTRSSRRSPRTLKAARVRMIQASRPAT